MGVADPVSHGKLERASQSVGDSPRVETVGPPFVNFLAPPGQYLSFWFLIMPFSDFRNNIFARSIPSGIKKSFIIIDNYALGRGIGAACFLSFFTQCKIFLFFSGWAERRWRGAGKHKGSLGPIFLLT